VPAGRAAPLAGAAPSSRPGGQKITDGLRLGAAQSKTAPDHLQFCPAKRSSRPNKTSGDRRPEQGWRPSGAAKYIAYAAPAPSSSWTSPTYCASRAAIAARLAAAAATAAMRPVTAARLRRRRALPPRLCLALVGGFPSCGWRLLALDEWISKGTAGAFEIRPEGQKVPLSCLNWLCSRQDSNLRY
jgi:hypothetical protein